MTRSEATEHTQRTYVVRELFPRMDQFDLINLDAFFFLQSLLDSKDLVIRLKIKRLLASRQGLNENLIT